MNALDSMSQIINAGLLANKEKAVDSVDIQIMTRTFNQQTYSIAFPKMQTWLNNISQSDEFKYIEAINNRTKHTADIANKLSMGILGSSNKTEIGPFFRKDVQHEKMELSDQLQATLDFLNKTWSDFLVLFKEEYVRDVYIENRRHSIGRLSDIACNEIYQGKYTYRHTRRGVVVQEDIHIQDGNVSFHIFPLPSSHAKGCVALEVNEEWCFLGDALYAMQKCEHNLYNTGILKEEINVLQNIKAEKLMLSHRTPFEKPKGIIMRWLSEIYDRRVKGEVYIEV